MVHGSPSIVDDPKQVSLSWYQTPYRYHPIIVLVRGLVWYKIVYKMLIQSEIPHRYDMMVHPVPGDMGWYD